MLQTARTAYGRVSGFFGTPLGIRSTRALYSVAGFALIGTGATMLTGNSVASFLISGGVFCGLQWWGLRHGAAVQRPATA